MVEPPVREGDLVEIDVNSSYYPKLNLYVVARFPAWYRCRVVAVDSELQLFAVREVEPDGTLNGATHSLWFSDEQTWRLANALDRMADIRSDWVAE